MSAVDLPVVEFVGPIVGFPQHREYVLVDLEPGGPVRSLRSIDDPDVRFLVIPPGEFFPSYAPEISDDWAAALELHETDDALLLVIVNPGESAAAATVNLMAPVVINVATRRAAQVVLGETDLPLRAPLAPAVAA
jgi:flagellar assembly factor FliW